MLYKTTRQGLRFNKTNQNLEICPPVKKGWVYKKFDNNEESYRILDVC